MTNPLSRLLVDSQELDADLLATILEPYVRIDKRTKEIRGTPRWSSLNATQKIIAYLLARKGMVALELVSPDEERASPSLIEAQSGVKGQTLRPILGALYRDRLVDKSDSRYLIPNYSIERAKDCFGNIDQGGTDGA